MKKRNNKNGVSWKMIMYEIRNILGNPFIYIFGLGLPIFMALMMSKVTTQDITDPAIIRQISTTVFVGIGVIIPMATMLIGYAAVYSQEIEKEIPIRMRLFGYSERCILINRMIAEWIFLTVAMMIYFGFGILFLSLEKPTIGGVISYLVCIYVLSVVLFMFSHAIASIFKKFGPTYAVTMVLYFVMMIFGGLMGMRYESMPKMMQIVARLLPVKYISHDFLDVWCGEAYNYVPMIQSYLFFAAVSGILLIISGYQSKRCLRV